MPFTRVACNCVRDFCQPHYDFDRVGRLALLDGIILLSMHCQPSGRELFLRAVYAPGVDKFTKLVVGNSSLRIQAGSPLVNVAKIAPMTGLTEFVQA